MNPQQLKNIIESALLTATGPLPMVRLQALFAAEEGDDADSQLDIEQIKTILDELGQDYAGRGIELKQVSSGYRIQARQEMGQWLNRLNEDRPSRYSRALLETLALIAYRQPITRAGVEDIRGVSVSSSIMKTLTEREWIRIVGHRDVPGRPALYGTSRQFLDYFNLKSLSELPPLAEMRSIEDIQREFDLNFDPPKDGAPPAGDSELSVAKASGTDDGLEANIPSVDATDTKIDPETNTNSESAEQLNEDADPSLVVTSAG